MAKILYADHCRSEGEERTARVLEGLPDHWIVICNKWLVAAGTDSYEVDFIVIGDGSVLCVDEKSWTGPVRGDHQFWNASSGYFEFSPLNKAELVARILATFIRRNVPRMSEKDVSGRFVVGCVSMTYADEKPRISDPRLSDQVFLLKDVVSQIIALDRKTGVVAIGRERDGIAKALYSLNHRRKIPKSIEQYEILDRLPAPPHPYIRRFRATHKSGLERDLTIYELRERSHTQRNFYLREFEALIALQGTGLVPQVDPYFEWSDGHFIVVPTARPTGTSYGALKLPESLDDFLDELRKSVAIFSGLRKIHSKGVIHRALNVGCIYFQESAEGYLPAFTDFWAARTTEPSGELNESSDDTISPDLNKMRENNTDPVQKNSAIENLTSAPELAVDYGKADSTTDTYAVSMMLLLRVAHTRAEDLRDQNGNLILSDSWDVWAHFGADIADELGKFFISTLSPDTVTSPGHGTGRLTAEECVEALLRILEAATSREEPENDEADAPELSEAKRDNGDPASEAVKEPIHVREEIDVEDGVADSPEERNDSKSSLEVDEQSGNHGHAAPLDLGIDAEHPVEDSSDLPNQGSQDIFTSAEPAPRENFFLRFGSARVAITSQGVSIGRDPDNDIVVGDNWASRKHAVAVLEGGRYVLKDVGSRNGTFVQGERVEYAILTGDTVIRIGRSEILVESEASEERKEISWNLILLSGPQDGLEFEVSSGITSIGRAPENDIALVSPSVSRKHARLIIDEDGFAVEDVGSTNGTYVNGSRLNFAVLESGDILSMGDTRIRVGTG